MNTTEQALKIPCGRCEAKIGDWCVTVSGDRAAELHTVRLDPIRDAQGAGYDEGRRDAQRLIQAEIEILKRGTHEATGTSFLAFSDVDNVIAKVIS